MKVCKRGISFLQIIDSEGTMRICGWQKDAGKIIGKLTEQSFDEIYHGKEMQDFVDMLARHDYSNCDIDSCHILANRQIQDQMVEIDCLPKYPEELFLAFEQTCNYRCTGCNIHNRLQFQKQSFGNLEEKYRLIEERIADVLPYVKLLSANGLGEVFCSPHILKLMSEWKPVHPKEEIRVELETNGSLFNEENWKKIENIGQYNLTVYVTVMSFEEKTYQYLSGTKLPIDNIKKNLEFISKLRKDGIVNCFHIATVYQESNFRSLPDFCRQALEYDPDYIRLRPYEPWGIGNRAAEWYADVRGKYHPSHQEFLEVMKDPIFKHPKVHDWSGGLDSVSNDFPLMDFNSITQEKCDTLTRIITCRDFISRLKNKVGTSDIVLYGLGNIGESLLSILEGKVHVVAVIDRDKTGECQGVPILKAAEAGEEIKTKDVLLTVMYDKNDLEQFLRDSGFSGQVIDVRELVCC